MTKEKSCVELSVGTSIPFKWLDDTPGGSNLGIAEFGIVLNFGKGRNVSGFYVFFLQQHNVNSYYHWKGGDIDFTIKSYEGLDDPNVWMIHKSEEPKGTCIHAYAPKGAKYLYIEYHGIVFLRTSLGEVRQLS